MRNNTPNSVRVAATELPGTAAAVTEYKCVWRLIDIGCNVPLSTLGHIGEATVQSRCQTLFLPHAVPHAVNCVRFCFLALYVTFCLCVKYLGKRWTDLCRIHREDLLGPSLGWVWMSRSKVKFTRDRFAPHWKRIVTRSLQITSCSRRDHSMATGGGGDGSAQTAAMCDLRCGLRAVYVW